MEAKHTPALRLCGAKRGGCDCRQIWNGEGNALVAVALEAADENYTGGEGYTKEAAKANAAEIVRRWNAHAQLVAALEECLSLAAGWAGYYSTAEAYGQNGVVHPTHQEIIDRAKAALALARGEKAEG